MNAIGFLAVYFAYLKPALSPEDHIRATRTMITLGADPAENPIFATVEDTVLAEEYAALLIEEAEAEAQDEG